MLKDIARLLNRCNKTDTFVTQYGIEEFVILLKDVGREKAIEVDEQIRKDIEDHICELTQSIQVDDSASVKVTASFGVGAYPDNCLNVYD